VAGEFWGPLSAIHSKNSTALCHILSHPLIIPSLVELIVPMHRSCGILPVCGGRPPRRGRGAASAKGLTSSGLPATSEALCLTKAFCAGVHHSPRFAAAPAAPADDEDNEDCGGESQPLLPPLLVLWP
jgi:hypothetical protein